MVVGNIAAIKNALGLRERQSSITVCIHRRAFHVRPGGHSRFVLAKGKRRALSFFRNQVQPDGFGKMNFSKGKSSIRMPSFLTLGSMSANAIANLSSKFLSFIAVAFELGKKVRVSSSNLALIAVMGRLPSLLEVNRASSRRGCGLE